VLADFAKVSLLFAKSSCDFMKNAVLQVIAYLLSLLQLSEEFFPGPFYFKLNKILLLLFKKRI